jgi:[acyl-carrier-protein] S-malonyltransferase
MRRRALVFPGQGAQQIGMCKDLYAAYPIAAQTLDKAQSTLSISLKECMFSGPFERLTQTRNTQPAILTHSIAVLEVLKKEYGFDVTGCDYALGHSLGEYSALVAAGALTFPDALKLVVCQLRLMELENEGVVNAGYDH